MKTSAFAAFAILGIALLSSLQDARATGYEIVDSTLDNVDDYYTKLTGEAPHANQNYYVETKQDVKKPNCYTFINKKNPASVIVMGGWFNVDSNETIDTMDLFTPVLRKGEKKRVCFEPPMNIQGKIRFKGVLMLMPGI